MTPLDAMRHQRLSVRGASRQRGAALLTAMIIVTLVATLATAMIWQQWRAVQVESAERARAQAGWILSGALQFAGLILKETVNPNKPTALTDPWATPLAEARLSTFLAADKANADDGPEAFLSGSIADAQARYNLANLVTHAAPPGGSVPGAGRPAGGQRTASGPTISPPDREALRRLCQAVGVSADVASRIADGMLRTALRTPDAPLQPETVAQLAWFGVDAAAVQALQPYVVLLPVEAKLNLNTASKEVLAAVIDNQTVADRIVQMRQRTPFKTVNEAKDLFGQLSEATAAQLDAQLRTQSTFFEVRGRLRLVDRVLVERSIVQRQRSGKVIVLSRERIASLEQLGG